jgi:hypothetical protein
VKRESALDHLAIWQTRNGVNGETRAAVRSNATKRTINQLSPKKRVQMRYTLIPVLLTALHAEDITPRPAPDPPPCSHSGIRMAESLTVKQKTCIWGDNLVSSSAIAGAAFFAFTNRETEGWQPGFTGYLERLGVKYAQTASKVTAEYIAGLLTGEDPRRGSELPGWHFRNDHNPGFGKRFGRALGQAFCTPRDGGGRCMPAVSHFAGAFASGFSTYPLYPARDTTADALRRSLNAYTGYITHSLFREFESDLYRIFIKRLRGKQGPPSMTGGANAK